MKAAEAAVQPLLLQVPQPPDADVPVGKDASENVVLYRWGQPRKFEFKPKSHIELGEALGILDFEAGVQLAGSRSYFLKGAGAELHKAVLRLAIDMMIHEKGFTPMTVPVLVRETAMIGTGFFPAGREQAYRVDAEDRRSLFLTGTAEVGLTAYHIGRDAGREATCRESTRPSAPASAARRAPTARTPPASIACTSSTSASRSSSAATTSRRASAGTWRCSGYSEEVLKRLNLPYRVIQCCTGDIGVKNASMMDIETWMPSRAERQGPRQRLRRNPLRLAASTNSRPAA